MGKRSTIFISVLLLTLAAVHAQSAVLSVDPGFPQGNLYAFSCAADFNATSYDLNFGDGNFETNDNGSAQHAYATDGEYTVMCDATDGNMSANDSLLVNVAFFNDNVTVNDTNTTVNETNTTINETNTTVNETNTTVNETDTTNETTVTNGTATITVKEWYPQLGAYVFECNTPGFTPTSYNWYYGDNMKGLQIQNQNVFHTYLENGNYHVVCQANDGNGVAREASLDIAITDIPRHNTCSIFQNTPATCNGGGVITQQDLGHSCRVIFCNGNGTERKALACDKPSADNPLYFEMYRVDSNQNSLEICVAGTCVGQNANFARSGLLTCDSVANETGNTTPPVNTTNTTNVTTNTTNETNTTNATNASVTLAMAPFYPQGSSVVLMCDASGYEPNSYEWMFGDNDTQTTSVDNVYHMYPGAGDYTATCSATDGTTTAHDDMVVTIAGGETNDTNSTPTNTT